MSATPSLTVETACRELDLLERRLHLSPARVLGIPDSATVVDAFGSFAVLAEIYDPRRFTSLPPQLAHRAWCGYQALQDALQEFVEGFRTRATRELPPDAPAERQSPS